MNTAEWLHTVANCHVVLYVSLCLRAGCNATASILQRMPELAMHVTLQVDRLHVKGHVGCDLAFDLNSFSTSDLEASLWGDTTAGQGLLANSQTAEQFHRYGH
jgi:hypothetical protein